MPGDRTLSDVDEFLPWDSSTASVWAMPVAASTTATAAVWLVPVCECGCDGGDDCPNAERGKR